MRDFKYDSLLIPKPSPNLTPTSAYRNQSALVLFFIGDIRYPKSIFDFTVHIIVRVVTTSIGYSHAFDLFVHFFAT